ncbi:MAG: segregation/condensation protein A [Lachnospiraceae bacterium]|jgi:segregation and condensation protein A|nr:segregation/condensation protein A [Lachnospiraceae bacterium]
MAIKVKLLAFEGPLDLLLHLIDKNKVDIHDIPIVMITEQYLEYIHAWEKEATGNHDEDYMDMMSEFLVMAATLLDIKTRMLLPKESSEEGEAIDPRAELVEQLLEFRMFKLFSQELRDRQVDARRNCFKEAKLPDEVRDYQEPIDYEALLGEATLTKLQQMLEMMLKRQVDKIDPIRSSFREVEKDEIDIEKKMSYVLAYLDKHRRFGFVELMEQQKSKMEMIVTFLVVLELIKVGRVTVLQEDYNDDIIIMAA